MDTLDSPRSNPRSLKGRGGVYPGDLRSQIPLESITNSKKKEKKFLNPQKIFLAWLNPGIIPDKNKILLCIHKISTRIKIEAKLSYHY